jgi:ATP-dependent protease La (LON) substrate-binding domain
MFPLNSVLFPYMPLRLRVFEERYLIMLAELLRREEARFGVVLIERGREVGGGEECDGGRRGVVVGRLFPVGASSPVRIRSSHPEDKCLSAARRGRTGRYLGDPPSVQAWPPRRAGRADTCVG